ncbi:MAG: hypothetical protein HW389_3017 [Bacteroidetes bacterium]|nr:hypothetical protein [Bacteroidota bacterium]
MSRFWSLFLRLFMTPRGKVTSLQICQGHRKAMLLLDEVNAVERLGLEGDIHALKENSRQVLLIEKETLDALKLRPAMLRENVTTEGIPLMSLRGKQRLLVGKAVLEITNECEPCERMEELRAGLQEQLMGRRGMLAKVVQGGLIRVGDPVTILS